MKLYSHPYSYTKEEFLENKKFSCHSWIPLSLEKINEIDIIVNQHQSFLNDKDLVGESPRPEGRGFLVGFIH